MCCSSYWESPSLRYLENAWQSKASPCFFGYRPTSINRRSLREQRQVLVQCSVKARDTCLPFEAVLKLTCVVPTTAHDRRPCVRTCATSETIADP